MFKLLVTLFMLVATASYSFGAEWKSSYVAHNNHMLNQERGTYVMFVYMSSNWQSIGAYALGVYKQQYYNTLILTEVVLDLFKWTPTLSSTVISQFNTEMQLYRSMGVKSIVRFVYTVSQGASKPWGDAGSAAIVFSHIRQLTPVLQANQDVIAYAQAGFVGIWGEWAYTDAFGDAGVISAQNYADRKTVHELLLAALPERTVQLRTPMFMQKFYGTQASTAIGSSNVQRTGNHNDCFLASDSDYGTYTNYATQYPYLSQQTKYTGSIFETCAVSSRSSCPTALKEIADLHMVSGHRMYNGDVWNQWISGGCYDTILKTLGHRLSLVSSTHDLQTAIGSSFSSSITIQNTGVSAPINARRTEIVMRKVDDGQICVATLPVDARTMQGGTTFTLSSKIRLPSNIAAGRWELLLQFADPYSTLYGVPWYKIQAANNVIYESGTGMHKLNAILDVSAGGVNAVSAGEVQAVCGKNLASIVNATVTTGDGTCLGGYYKAGGTCTMCPAGAYCSSSSSSPISCPANTWSAGGQRSCTQCTSCSGKGTCQAKTGACLCISGASGFDCSVGGASVITAQPTQPSTPTKEPVTVPAGPNGPVMPVSSTGCTKATNLLVNSKLTPTGSVINGWTSGGSGYMVATGIGGQPSAQLYIPAGTVGASKSISQTVTFATPTTSTISFGAYISSYLISGVLDWDYMLYIGVNYIDGSVVTYGVRTPVGSTPWTWIGSSFNPVKGVQSVSFTFTMSTHTGNAYMTQPVLVLAPACSVTGGPVGVTGSSILSGEDTSTMMGLSQDVWLGIYIACGAVVLMIAAGVGVFIWRKRKQEAAVETAVAAQMTSV